jgi:predicted nucleic acid-binding protein
VENEAYVDVNMFIYWLGAHPEYGDKAREWVKKIESSQGGYSTSALTLYEVPVILSGLTGGNLKDESLISKVVESFTALVGLSITPLELLDFSTAYRHMRDYNLDLEDALHLASAEKTGAERIITNDEDFNSTPLERVF